MGKVARTPARDKVRPFIPKALAEGWSVRKLARESGVSTAVAGPALKDASRQSESELQNSLSKQNNRSLRVASQLRNSQIDRAERIDKLSEQILDDLEEKVRLHRDFKGKESKRPPYLNSRELETLVKLQEKQWMHVKDMAGISLAEKMLIGRAKGEAQGAAIGSALIDSTAIDIGNEVWLETEAIEAEEVVD